MITKRFNLTGQTVSFTGRLHSVFIHRLEHLTLRDDKRTRVYQRGATPPRVTITYRLPKEEKHYTLRGRGEISIGLADDGFVDPFEEQYENQRLIL